MVCKLQMPKNIGRWISIGPNTGLLDLWFGLRVWKNFFHTLSPLPGPVADHVDSDFIRYVVYSVWRAARVLPASPKFGMHVM